jgi:hypothetical protein
MSISTANLSTTTAAVYTSVGQTVVTFMSLANYTAANVTANVYVVPSGDTAANSNIVLASIDLTALDTYQIYAGNEKLLLGSGDSIQADASANSSVTVVTSFSAI